MLETFVSFFVILNNSTNHIFQYLGKTVTEKHTSVMSYVWLMLEAEGKIKTYFCSYNLTNLTCYYQF